MRILVYEHVCASGPRRTAAWQALLPEGRAMLAAVVRDFVAAAGCTVKTIVAREAAAAVDVPGCERVNVDGVDRRLEDELAEALHTVDAALLICPEGGDSYDRWFAGNVGATILGPSADFSKLAGDKHATVERLRKRGVQAPEGVVVGPQDTWPATISTPVVVKPLEGCGCQNTRLVREPSDFARVQQETVADGSFGSWRVERFIPGQAASVAVLCGPAGLFPLPPCRQHVEIDARGALSYNGGSLPMRPDHAERARRLAVRALEAMPRPLGYVGVDLVLGAAADGGDDYVIEINPRLTTSYIGLRAAAETNLAAAMLDVVAGRTPELRFRDVSVRFEPHGQVTVEHELAGA